MQRLLILVLLIVIGSGGVMADTSAPLYQEPRKPPEKVKDPGKQKPDDRDKKQGSKDDKKKDNRKKPEFS